MNPYMVVNQWITCEFDYQKISVYSSQVEMHISWYLFNGLFKDIKYIMHLHVGWNICPEKLWKLLMSIFSIEVDSGRTHFHIHTCTFDTHTYTLTSTLNFRTKIWLMYLWQTLKKEIVM